jgi:hypothetical protein
MLKYAVALAVLLLIIMGNVSARHDSSHIAKTDLHCALCLSPHNVDHGLPSSALKFNIPSQRAVTISYTLAVLPSSLKPKVGNRDPPFVILF